MKFAVTWRLLNPILIDSENPLVTVCRREVLYKRPPGKTAAVQIGIPKISKLDSSGDCTATCPTLGNCTKASTF